VAANATLKQRKGAAAKAAAFFSFCRHDFDFANILRVCHIFGMISAQHHHR